MRGNGLSTLESRRSRIDSSEKKDCVHVGECFVGWMTGSRNKLQAASIHDGFTGHRGRVPPCSHLQDFGGHSEPKLRLGRGRDDDVRRHILT